MDTHEFARKVWTALAETLPTVSVCNAEIGINATNFRLDIENLDSSNIDRIAVTVYREKGPGATKLFITEPRVSNNGHCFVIEFSFRWDVPKVERDPYEALCIGGALDGKTTASLETTLRAFERNGNAIKEVNYHLRKIDVDGTSFRFWIPEGESRKPADIIGALIEGYRQ